MRNQQVIIEGQEVQAVVVETNSKVYTAVMPQDAHKVSTNNLFTEKSK
jgi:hypothetical protein